MTRKALLVGSLPVDYLSEAYKLALEELGGYLLALPDGEPGRTRWVVDVQSRLAKQGPFYVKKEGDWKDYDNAAVLGVMRDVDFTSDVINLGYFDLVEQSKEAFLEAKRKYGFDLPYLVSVPNPPDTAIFVLGLRNGVKYLKQFFDATIEEIRKIQLDEKWFDRDNDNDPRFVFQLEDPFELIGTTLVPKFLHRIASKRFARSTNAYNWIDLCPDDTLFSRHHCLGDLGHKAKGSLRSVVPLVTYVNDSMARWPSDRRSPFYVHLPLAAGQYPPETNLDFYEGLRDLKVPASTRVVAGVCHEGLREDQVHRIVDRIEVLLDREVDVAASCGLARRSLEAALVTMRQARELCEASV